MQALPPLSRTSFRACTSFCLAYCLAYPALAANIADPVIRSGTVAMTGIGSNNLQIKQSSDKAIIDWRAFSVDAGSLVQFTQPGASSIALNRITGSGGTRVDGSLLANGQVWLLNPNGVLIGSGGRVSAGGFLATTHAIADDDFLAGRYHLTSDGAARDGVYNLGTINIADGGYAVLAGNQVGNAGLVQARLGEVVLGAGKSFVLDVAGDKLLSFAVSEPLSVVSAGTMVDNRGTLSAEGGRVLLTAKAAANVVSSVVNTSGVIDATSARNVNGAIVLDGGANGIVTAGGTLDASGKGSGETGGAIKIFGETVLVGGNALLDARGAAGGGAIYVGGGWQGESIDGHASAVRAGVAGSATLDASAIDTGDGGTIVLWSDVNNAASVTRAHGTFYARGGANGGNGGRIETSGRYLATTNVDGSAAAPLGRAGTWLFDPYNVEIVASPTGGGTAANIINPGFDNGFTGWTQFGPGPTAQTVTSASSDPQGSNGQVQTFQSQVQPGSPFALIWAGNEPNTNNGLEQTFTATAGQYFNFFALFLGRDYLPFNDSATVQLIGPSGTTTLYTRNIEQLGNYGFEPWVGQTINLTQTGTYTIRAFARNDQDNLLPSMLGFEISTAAPNSSMGGGFINSGMGQQWQPTNSPSRIDVAQIHNFLNNGTNVQVTTGTLEQGTEAGNITVSAAINKSAGGNATLRLDAHNAIFVNQAIGSSAGELNVILNAGSGGISLGAAVNTNNGDLTLNSTGSVTQSAAFTADQLILNGAGGSHSLTEANSFNRLVGNTGSINLFNTAELTTFGAVTTSGGLNVAGNGALRLDGTVTIGGDSLLLGDSSITLGEAARINAGADIALVAATDFVNQSGSDAIVTSNGARWLIYSQAPESDSFGGLASGNFALWGNDYESAPPEGIETSGNRYIFAASPTVTISPVDSSATYGDFEGRMTFGEGGGEISQPQPQFAFNVSGLVDAASFGNVFSQDVVEGTPAFFSEGLGFRAPVGEYSLGIGQGSLTTTEGYQFAFGENAILTIDPRELLASLTGTVTKTYDRTTTATLASGNYDLSGVLDGDDVALNNPTTGSYDNRNAGTGKTVSVNGLALSGESASNYFVNTSASGAIGTIDPKALTASLTGPVAKTYDGTTAATLAASNYALGGVIAGDTVTLNNPTSGSYDNRNADTGKTVNVSGLAINGADAGNYTVNAIASGAVGTINAKALTAALTGTVSKIYDGTNAATLAANNYTLSGVVAGDAVTLNNPVAGTYANRNAGTGKTVNVAGIALTGGDAGNYTVNSAANGAVGTISAKALTLAALADTKTYDGTTVSTKTGTATGLVAGDSVSTLTQSFDSRNAGSRTLALNAGFTISDGNGGANYAVTTTTAAGTIDPKALTASLAGAVSKIYDGTTAATLAAANYALTGVVSGDAVTLNNPTSGSYDNRNAGTGKIVSVAGIALGGSDAGNYTVNSAASGAIGLIDPKALTASLTGTRLKTYDGTTAATLSAANYVLSGAIAGDAVALNNPTSGSYDTRNVGSGKTISVTGLALNGGDAGNYTVNGSASGALGTIDPKTLTASLTGTASKIYDGSTAATLAAGNYVVDGIVAGDSVALNNPTTGSYDNRNAGTGKTVTVTGLALGGTDASNYFVATSTSGAIGAIDPKALTASLAGAVSKTYDGTTAATLAAANYALNGVVAGDAVALNNPTAGSLDTRNVGTGKTVSVNGLALGGGDAGNYTVNAAASAAIGTVAAKALTLAASSDSKTYDGTTISTALATANGLVAGDSVSALTQSFDSKNAGSRTLSVNSGFTVADGNGGANYAVSLATAAGTIDPRALTIALTGSTTKVYNGNVAALLNPTNFAIAGFVAGEGATVTQTAGTFVTKNVGTNIIVNAQLNATQLSASASTDLANYIVPRAAGAATIGTITPAPLTLALTGNVSRVANGGTGATLAPANYALTGFVSGESATVTQTMGSYATSTAGSGIPVTTTIASNQFSPGSNTLLSNYSVPTGTFSAPIGTITPAPVTMTTTVEAAPPPPPPPPPPPAPTPTPEAAPPPPAGGSTDSASAAPADDPTTPEDESAPASAAAPAAPPPAAAPASTDSAAPAGGDSAATETAPPPPVTVEASPPSPVPAEKPPTPQDSADVSDPILATVEAPSEEPAPNPVRQLVDTVEISAGILTAQQPTPPRSTDVPGLDQAFSGSGNPL